MQRSWLIVFLALAAGCSSATSGFTNPQGHVAKPFSQVGHIVVVMMENRSFDSYFGTYPGVNGIPSDPTCNMDPRTHQCIYPYHDTNLVNYGGPHGDTSFYLDLDGGKLDGFVSTAARLLKLYDPNPDEVMGYHTCAEVPEYCALAQNGVLADNAYAASTSWSMTQHAFLVSNWSASCSIQGDPMSCVSDNHLGVGEDYAWTDLTWILHEHDVSWGYYVYPSKAQGPAQPNNDDENPGPDDEFNKPGIWNPLPSFDDVKLDGQIGNIQPGTSFDAQAAAGTLPQVVWVVPPFDRSDHPPTDISHGQGFIKRIVGEVTSGPDGSSTVIILLWDEWGGFYDHVVPPVIDGLGYGFRVPMLLTGPLVKKGVIDHQLLSTDAVNKFIEDEFVGGERLDNNDGRPDSRPDVREETPGLGDLRLDLK